MTAMKNGKGQTSSLVYFYQGTLPYLTFSSLYPFLSVLVLRNAARIFRGFFIIPSPA